MKIPSIMRRFSVQVEYPIMRCFSLIYIFLLTLILIIYFINTNITISFIWNKQLQELVDDSNILKRNFQSHIDSGLKILNMSRGFYEVKNSSILNNSQCDGARYQCYGTFQGQVYQMYDIMYITYKKLFPKNCSLIFFIDSNSSASIALTFQFPELISMYNSLNMTEIMKALKQKVNPSFDAYIYFYKSLNYLVSCLRIHPNNSIYTCNLISQSVLDLQTNRNFFILLNDEVFYTSTSRDDLNISSLIRSYTHLLYNLSYIQYSQLDQIVEECISDYQNFDQNGIYQCLYSSTKLWSFPIMFEQLYITLPTIYYRALSFYRQQYIMSSIKLIILPNIQESYKKCKEEIDFMKKIISNYMRYSVIIFIGVMLTFKLNRLFVKFAICNKIDKIGDQEIDQTQLIPTLPLQLQSVAKTIEKYQWVLLYSRSQPQNFQKVLLEGLKIFQSEQSQYLSIVRYIYNTLIYMSEASQKYLQAAQLYQKLIDLQMQQLLKKDDRINSSKISQVYQFQLNRIQNYLKSAQKLMEKEGRNITEREMGIGLEELFIRLEEYKDHLDIQEVLVQRGVVLKVKLRYIYGVNNSYKLLEQLQNSKYDENIRNQIRYIYALQLRKKKPLFDIEAIEKLVKALKTKTTSQFKRKCLKLIIQILDDYPEEFAVIQSEFIKMSCFYNTKKKSLFIRRQCHDRSHEKTYELFIKEVHEVFGKAMIDEKSINQIAESVDNLRDSRLTSNYNISNHSNSYSFMKDLKGISQSGSDDCKFVVIYRNDLLFPEKEKDKQQKREFMSLMQSVGTYLHIIVVGVNIKEENLNKNKMIRLLKEKNSLMYVDLNDYDHNQMKEQLKAFTS